ncbi:MAG: GIY-YIG nuclease family protein [Candidatus Magasanikbacteria bacterium]|nr:GIY-YIG nuclease family protein [Candidatus Magasanikbacteria bacterium]
MYHIVYFLESMYHPDRHYIGYTTDLKKRLSYHNAGINQSTKRYRPWKIIYAEAYLTKKDALGREKFLKSGSGWKFLKKQLIYYFKEKNNIPLCASPEKEDQKKTYSPILK